MTAMTRSEAERLYTILDAHIGVFRQEEMPERAKSFYDEKREEFLETFTQGIPESYWFQGIACNSVSLMFDSIEGFHLVSDNASNHVKKVLADTTEKIKGQKVEITI